MLQTSSIQGVFRVDFCPVVTNVVNPSAFSVKMLVFGLRLTTFVTEVLARRCESCWFDDVCNVGRPLVARPGSAAAHGYRSLALSARWLACLKPPSPLLAGICVGLKPPSPLRVRNRCFLARFSGAEVMVVSMVAVQGRAVVLSVSKSPRCRASCAKKFALRGLMCA